MKKSMIEIANTALQQNGKAMPFIDLWKVVSKEMGYNASQADDNIAQFYTDLSLDGRFFSMAQNNWDLRSRHKYSESVMDTDSISVEEEEEAEETSEEEE